MASRIIVSLLDDMGALNVASFGLLIGAIGQRWFYARLFPQVPTWVVWGILCLPGLTVFTISLTKRPPFGPRPFRFCLLFIVGWYALVTIAAEVIQLRVQFPPDGHIPVSAARILMYLGALSLVVFIRASFALRRHETQKDA